MNFSFYQRTLRPEILDTLSPDEARASLGDLVRLNRNFGGLSALGHALDDAGIGAGERVTLLDVGAASGDMGREVRRRCPLATVTSLDALPAHLEAADAPRVAGDAFRLPFRDAAFDFAYSSLFLHHFTDHQVVALFGEMRRVSRRGVLAVDLVRSPIAYWFVPATRWIFGWDPVTVHDAAASVAAGFRVPELERLARRAGLRDARVRSHGLSYRLSMAAKV